MILKAENVPQIGAKVIDENLQPVGKVFDVIGATSSPYVTVKPDVSNPHNFKNRILYAVPSRARTRGRKERKKRG